MKVTFSAEEVKRAAALSMHRVVSHYDAVEASTEVYIQRSEPKGVVISLELQLDNNELVDMLKEIAETTFENAEVKGVEFRRTKEGIVADIDLKTREG